MDSTISYAVLCMRCLMDKFRPVRKIETMLQAVANHAQPRNIHLLQSGKAYLLFDGDCPVCRKLAHLAKRICSDGMTQIIAYQSVPEAELLKYHLNYAKCSAKVRYVSRKSRASGGAFAINNFMLSCGAWAVFPIIAYLCPPLLLAEMAGYRIFSAHRRAISRILGV